MIKPEFENLEIDFWRHREKGGYKEPTLCVFHATLDQGSPFLGALTELEKQSYPARRTISFAPSSRKSAFEKLTLMLVAEREDLKVMNIRCTSAVATIEMTDRGLALLVDAVHGWLAGDEDFGISPRRSALKPKQLGELDRASGELWFWGPHFGGP